MMLAITTFTISITSPSKRLYITIITIIAARLLFVPVLIIIIVIIISTTIRNNVAAVQVSKSVGVGLPTAHLFTMVIGLSEACCNA